MSDLFAKSMTKFFALLRHSSAKRYGHRAIVLETIAGVPGMVAGMWLHFKKSTKKMKVGYGPDIREMLAEAENERMHLMFFIQLAKPNWFERTLVLLAQAAFMLFYFLIYIISYKTAHRMIAYFEEEAVISYTEYLKLVESGEVENVPAPHLASAIL